MGSAHGGNSTRRPCVGQRISRGQCCSQTVLPQTRTSRQRRGARVCTIRPRRPHCGHRHPVLWGFTAITRSPLPRPSNQKSTARNPLNFNSFDTNLTAVIGRSPCPLRDGLMSSNTKPRERPMALSCTQRFGVGKTGLSHIRLPLSNRRTSRMPLGCLFIGMCNLAEPRFGKADSRYKRHTAYPVRSPSYNML